MNYLWFDIETGPEDGALEKFAPEFEPDAKLTEPKLDTRLKDPVKIAAAEIELADRRIQWEKAKADSVSKQAEEWEQKGALRAERGVILAIGYALGDGPIELVHGYDERRLIQDFLCVLHEAVNQGATVAGFNCEGFDLPFTRRRCLVHGDEFPFYNRADKWKPWRFQVYDAMKDWACGNYRDYVALGDLMIAFGVGRKNGDGGEFHKTYATDPNKALEYLRNDVHGTRGVCKHMLQ